MTPTTLSLLDWQPPVAAPRAPEQPANLARVGGRIGPHVLGFCRRLWAQHERFPRVATFQYFRPSDLVAFLAREGVTCAPASADRILRDLRRGGFVSYTVVNRAASLYRLDGITQKERQP
jgi:hypothetical protein